MPQVGFDRTLPGFQRAKTVHALDRAATVIGKLQVRFYNVSLAADQRGQQYEFYDLHKDSGIGLTLLSEVRVISGSTDFRPRKSMLWKGAGGQYLIHSFRTVGTENC
jgi:hypothetical protein